MTPVLRLDQATKRFDGRTALDQVTCEVPPGTVFALLGENGAGKSTAIRALLGLVELDSGRAEVLGLDSRRQGDEIRRRVGYVPERPTLYDWMTVGEIGWFAAGFYDSRFLPRYEEAARRFALPLARKIKALSKGMRAKVSLALALGNDPELLVLDEPTSGLDTLVRREFLESMVERAAAGKTVFLSSHQIGEVERVADVVAILHGGKLVVVERLEKLKAEVQELTVTLADPSAEPPLVTGELLRQRRRSRQWQVLVRRAAEAELATLAASPIVADVQRRTPSLEEIFVAYLKRDGQDVDETSDANVVPCDSHAGRSAS